MKYLWLIPLITLGACASAPEAVTPQLVMAPQLPPRPFLRSEVPVSSMTCQDEPDGLAVKTSRQAAVYILSVKAAGRDCRSKLKSVRALIQNEQ